MKTNILWKKSKVIGTITGSNPSLDHLPFNLVMKYRANLSIETTPPSIAEFTDTDGGIYGVRYFDHMPSSSGAGLLVSPTSRFIWESAYATAKDFANIGAVRGHIGFHAAWPISLRDWPRTNVDHQTCTVKALVKGYGDLIQGTMGWRSQKLQLISLICEHWLPAAELAAKYGIPCVHGVISNYAPTLENRTIEWTPEFQSWLAQAFPVKKKFRKGEYD
jgi:hypothetical protein